MDNSILNSIKALLFGVGFDDESFDNVLLMHINTVIAVLHQLGIIDNSDFTVESAADTWEDLIDDLLLRKMVREYIGCEVRLKFDPPQTSFVLQALQDNKKELEARMMIRKDDLNLN